MPSVLAGWLLLRTVAIPWFLRSSDQLPPTFAGCQVYNAVNAAECRRSTTASADVCATAGQVLRAPLPVLRLLVTGHHSFVTCGFFCSGKMTPHKHTHTHTCQVPRQLGPVGVFVFEPSYPSITLFYRIIVAIVIRDDSSGKISEKRNTKT
jgi:hypothetical protein